MFAERRDRVLKAMGRGVMVLPAAEVVIRNNDVEHAYRQDSDFHYLTGFDEPESVLVLSTEHEHRSVLFVRPRNKEREIWDGPRAGVEGALERYGVDAAYTIDELPKKLPDYLGDVDRVHVRVGRGEGFDAKLFAALDVVRRRARQGVAAPTELVDPGKILHELRLRKTSDELEVMRRAAKVTHDAHVRAMQETAPGRFEYEVEAEIRRIFRAGGCERAAYESIVGSGPNACILHYRANDRKMGEGELLLIDAGCELEYYASDVTRTFPVSGTFSAEQRVLYELVLEAEKAGVDAARPGKTLDDIHQVTSEIIARGLLEHGLLEGSFDEVMEKHLYKKFFMHKTSHWIGMDVHDVGIYFVEGKARPLEPGFVLTVEPGIYVAPDADVDERWRGIGIRIEDDVCVREDGPPENLTEAIPKEIADVEAACA